jgi:hypothetical protein
MVKRLIVFIVSIAALVSFGLVKCSSTGPYAESNVTGLDDSEDVSVIYLYSE